MNRISLVLVIGLLFGAMAFADSEGDNGLQWYNPPATAAAPATPAPTTDAPASVDSPVMN
jgi:hypothetical protein